MRQKTRTFRVRTAGAAAVLAFMQAAPPPALAQAPLPAVIAPAGPGQQAADPPERVGRVARINGAVSYHSQDATTWTQAAANYPVAQGDALWTEPGASAQIEIAASRIALFGGTELDITRLDPGGIQAALPQGEAYWRLQDVAPGESWSVQTPRGEVTFSGPGRYGIRAGDAAVPTLVTVLDGHAVISGAGLALEVAASQTATITGDNTFAGSIGPAEDDPFLTAMLESERPPPRPAVTPPPEVAQMPGGDDLAAYGSWAETPAYGPVWYPQVGAGWVPYRQGHWAYVAPWGWTWIDGSPWGFAPFHYGRWVDIGGRWAWVPGGAAVAAPPVYAPALVTFFGIGLGAGIGAGLAAGTIGWCPLGPREAYHPWYHASRRYVRAVNVHNVTNITTVNRNVTINNFINRSATTVVPAAALASSRPVPQAVRHVDPRILAGARPIVGVPPVRPTAATAGMTPALTQRMHVAPASAGVSPPIRPPAPGPAIHHPTPQGVAVHPVQPLPRHPAAAQPAAVPHPLPPPHIPEQPPHAPLHPEAAVTQPHEHATPPPVHVVTPAPSPQFQTAAPVPAHAAPPPPQFHPPPPPHAAPPAAHPAPNHQVQKRPGES